MLVRSREPLYMQIRNLLAEKICNGELQPGERLPPDPEFAGYLGVNRLTLAKALNLLRRENYVDRYARKGTFVKERHDAQSLAHGANAKLVAVLFDDATEATFHSGLFISIHNALQSSGCAMKFLSAQSDGRVQFEQLQALIRGGHVVGAIVWSVMTADQTRKIMALRLPLFPIIFIDRCVEGLPMDFSGYDDVHAGRLLARHLLEIGCRKVCVLDYSAKCQISVVRDRLRGLQEEIGGEPAVGTGGMHVRKIEDAGPFPIRRFSGKSAPAERWWPWATPWPCAASRPRAKRVFRSPRNW